MYLSRHPIDVNLYLAGVFVKYFLFFFDELQILQAFIHHDLAVLHQIISPDDTMQFILTFFVNLLYRAK